MCIGLQVPIGDMQLLHIFTITIFICLFSNHKSHPTLSHLISLRGLYKSTVGAGQLKEKQDGRSTERY